MIKYCCCLIFLLIIQYDISQQIRISRYVIGSYGSSHTIDLNNTTLTGVTIMDNVGEVAITTAQDSINNIHLTQGFEQPFYSLSPIVITFNPPNAFSPNNDGTNDIWILPLYMDVLENKVIIFNRWGDIIRSFDNYNNLDVAWDGTNKHGEPVTAGTYFYVIEFFNSGQSSSGWVQVVR